MNVRPATAELVVHSLHKLFPPLNKHFCFLPPAWMTKCRGFKVQFYQAAHFSFSALEIWKRETRNGGLPTNTTHMWWTVLVQQKSSDKHAVFQVNKLSYFETLSLMLTQSLQHYLGQIHICQLTSNNKFIPRRSNVGSVFLQDSSRWRFLNRFSQSWPIDLSYPLKRSDSLLFSASRQARSSQVLSF